MPTVAEILAELARRKMDYGGALRGAWEGLKSLPERATQSAGSLQYGGSYDPGPVLEAAMLPMGGTFAGAPRGAMGAGPVRRGAPVGVPRVIGPSSPVAAPAVRNPATPLFDYRNLKVPPNVPQFDLPRRVPRAGTELPPEYQAALSPEGRAKLDEYVRQGIGVGGMNWHNMMPLKEAYQAELGMAKGEKAFNDYMDAIAATSPDMRFASNVRTGSYYNMLRQTGQPMPPLVKSLKGNWMVPPGEIPNPYGARAQALHVQNMNEVMSPTGWDVLAHPKPPSLGENLKGNYQPIALDRHEMRKMGIEGIPESRYGILEKMEQEQAAGMGIRPAQYQASGWLGGAGDTNMISGNIPALQHVENRIGITAEQQGIPKARMLRDFIRANSPLLGVAGAAPVAAPYLNLQSPEQGATPPPWWQTVAPQ